MRREPAGSTARLCTRCPREFVLRAAIRTFKTQAVLDDVDVRGRSLRDDGGQDEQAQRHRVVVLAFYSLRGASLAKETAGGWLACGRYYAASINVRPGAIVSQIASKIGVSHCPCMDLESIGRQTLREKVAVGAHLPGEAIKVG